MSRPNVTDEIIEGLDFARACVLDQRVAAHNRKNYSWDKRYAAALAALDFVVGAHKFQSAQSQRAIVKRKTITKKARKTP